MAPRGIEAMVSKWRTADTTLAKPLTFMNASGPAVVGLVQFFKLEIGDVLVVVDDTNLELGRLRTRAGGSAGGHNGLKSIIERLGTTEFSRLRLGVGRGDGRRGLKSLIEALGTDQFPRMRLGVGRGDARRDLADHVLARFDSEERAAVAELIARASEAVELFVTEGIHPVMNKFNRKEDRKEETE
jgi:peptidyl-tRNA hydrolase, PTH1 family